MKKKILLSTVALLSMLSLSAANSAVDWSVIADTSDGLPGTASGRLIWGDFNNDGHKDAFIIAGQGTGAANLFKNNGDGTFTEVQSGFFTGLSQSSAVFIDYDNDGNLDLVTVGFGTSKDADRRVYVYRNTGATGSYLFEVDATQTAQLIGTCAGTNDAVGRLINAFDYNNDGWIDLVIMGYFQQETGIDEQQYGYLYKNVNGSFVKQENIIDGENFPTAAKGSVHIGDVNNDGYQDILMQGAGWVYAPQAGNWDWQGAYLYINNQDGTFSLSSYSPNLAARDNFESILADVNDDGNVDIVEINWGEANIHFGNGDGTFTKSVADVTGLLTAWGTSITTGDINNDGLTDILVSGMGGDAYPLTNSTKIFYNNGDDTFTPADVSGNMQARSGSVALVDIDGDGNLDYSAFGYGQDWATVFAKNTLNTGITANTAPTVPTNFAVSYSGGKFSFSWTASTDDFTPAAALRYNIYAKDETTGKIYAYAPVDITSGKLKIGGSIVPLIAQTSFELTLPDGTYTFGVQAVDQSDAASVFVTFSYPYNPSNINENLLEEVKVISNNQSLTILNPVSSDVDYTVLSANGKVIEQGICKSGETYRSVDLNTGIYFVKLVQNGVVSTKKVVVL